jgi:Saxitoxin biosynthesis operon protein SxtJ
MAFLHRKISKDQCRDTGMAMVLLLLVVDIRAKRGWVLLAAIALLVLNMTVPRIYRPIAVLWLGLSDLLGTLVSKILLSIVFFLVVVPIGVLRRLAGKDSLKLRAFKAGNDSVMVERSHIFVGRDLERPF